MHLRSMAAIFGPGGTIYSATDGPGGPIMRGDHPRRDSTIYVVSSNVLCFLSHSKTVWKTTYMPSQKSHDNIQKLGVVAVNHMNHDVRK